MAVRRRHSRGSSLALCLALVLSAYGAWLVSPDAAAAAACCLHCMQHRSSSLVHGPWQQNVVQLAAADSMAHFCTCCHLPCLLNLLALPERLQPRQPSAVHLPSRSSAMRSCCLRVPWIHQTCAGEAPAVPAAAPSRAMPVGKPGQILKTGTASAACDTNLALTLMIIRRR